MLSSSSTRAVYDQFGEEGLKSGVPTTDLTGGFSGGYVFHGNPDKVFREFFGGDNPFNEFFEPPKDPDMAIGRLFFIELLLVIVDRLVDFMVIKMNQTLRD